MVTNLFSIVKYKIVYGNEKSGKNREFFYIQIRLHDFTSDWENIIIYYSFKTTCIIVTVISHECFFGFYF